MKRFYKDAAAEQVAGGWQVALDARLLKTVGKRPQVVPTRKLAHALADEWQAQGEELASHSFILRDMADYAIDVIAPDRAGAIRSLLPYAETDTLCYRGEAGEALHEKQLAEWEPMLSEAEGRYGVRFERVDGIMHRPQPGETIARLEAVLGTLDEFTLAALRNLASLAASMVIGLAALEPDADPHALWNAANLEDDWQAELWGRDPEAMALRERRFGQFAAAMRFAELVRAEP